MFIHAIENSGIQAETQYFVCEFKFGSRSNMEIRKGPYLTYERAQIALETLQMVAVDEMEKEYRNLYWKRNELDLIAGDFGSDPRHIWESDEYKTIASRMIEICGELGYVPAA